MINDKTLKELVKKFRYDFFLYPNDIFELRIQEEMQRSELTNSNFIYAEFPYNAFEEVSVDSIEEVDYWADFFHIIAKSIRGFDIKGFLSENRGMGIVFVDCPTNHEDFIKQRILSDLKNMNKNFDRDRVISNIKFLCFSKFQEEFKKESDHED